MPQAASANTQTHRHTHTHTHTNTHTLTHTHTCALSPIKLPRLSKEITNATEVAHGSSCGINETDLLRVEVAKLKVCVCA
jgi:hypothetical protein